MISNRIFRFAASLALTAVLVSCATSQEETADERIVVIPEEESFELLFPKSEEEERKHEVKPGKIYLGSDIDGIYELKSIQGTVNEDGRLTTAVVGSTAPYSFWKWLFVGEKERRIAYRFLWFDKDGKLISTLLNSVPGIRATMPGDPVRFSGLAPDEKATQFSIVFNLLDKKEEDAIQEAQALKGAALDKLDPAKKEPLKEVKIEK